MKPSTVTSTKPILRALAGETLERPPIWIMRQAGRYLPEYRETRSQAGGFLELCYSPDLATEVTLQPIRRYGFDAAILFADILLIPHALGQDLWFETGEGPKLKPIADISTLSEPEAIHETLAPVYETVRRVSAALPDDVALIGFAGAPWTVATYMIAGRGTKDQGPAFALMKSDPAAFDQILDRVADATILYLSKQIEAGAEVVKIFDSWAGSLKGEDFERACLRPTKKIVDALRRLHPDTPVIGFPRGSGERAEEFVSSIDVNGVAIEQGLDPIWARDHLQTRCAVQGNLDPSLLLGEGEGLEQAAEEIISALGQGPFIFNLGHGVTPDVLPENVARLVRAVKG